VENSTKGLEGPQDVYCIFCSLISEAKLTAMSGASLISDPHLAFQENARRAAFFWRKIEVLELAYRNRLASAIERYFSAAFFTETISEVHPDIRSRVEAARRRIHTDGKQAARNAIISELSLGFWGSLLKKHYESLLWAPALRHAFAGLGKTSRAEVYDALQTAIVLRNRIAHHENILRYDPKTTLATLDWLLELLEPGSSQFTNPDEEIPLHPVE
jgi:hypothetical protein